jgi:ferredoxin
MASVTVRIDGREIAADSSQTILQVARANGVHIPTLCYDPRLPPYGSCLVCVVEVRRRRLPCAPLLRRMTFDRASRPPPGARRWRCCLESLRRLPRPVFPGVPPTWTCRGICARQRGMSGRAQLVREMNLMLLACGRVTSAAASLLAGTTTRPWPSTS